MSVTRLLVALWALTAIAMAVSDELGVSPATELSDGEAVQPIELVQVKKDGCSGAYKKFKANIAKMQALKTKAQKQAAKSKKATKKATGLLKRCKKDQKEVWTKANWKKAVIKKKIAIGSDKRFAKLKKKRDAKDKKLRKKTKATVKKAHKKMAAAIRKMKGWQAKYKKFKVDSKARYKQKMLKYKNAMKAKLKASGKNKVADTIARKSREIHKKEVAKYKAKLKGKMQEFDHKVAAIKKKNFLHVEDMKTDTKHKVKKARAHVPSATATKLATTIRHLKSKTKEAETLTTKLHKTAADLKDLKATSKAAYSKMHTRYRDCTGREKTLRKDVASKRTSIKMKKVKISDQASTIQRLKMEIRKLKAELGGTKTALRNKTRQAMLCSKKLAETQNTVTKKKSKIKTIKSQMSAGQGALMGEIERNKKRIHSEVERATVLGNSLGKKKLDYKKVVRRLNRYIVKSRMLGTKVYQMKRLNDGIKAKLRRLTAVKNSQSERYVSVKAGLKLCQGRVNDAKVKAQACSEAMRRMKTYTGDTINRQTMKNDRLQQKLNLEKEKAHALALSRAEKAKANKLAKTAAEKAATKATAAANAKALATKHNAKEAVAQAAKAAVKNANARARKAAAKKSSHQ